MTEKYLKKRAESEKKSTGRKKKIKDVRKTDKF